jgi:transposase-like protein
MGHAFTNPPNCPICRWNDEVTWLSHVVENGEIISERWVCAGCQAMFGADRQRRLSKPWMIVALAAAIAVPAVRWHHWGAATDASHSA